MNIDDKTIDYIANVSKLEFKNEEKTAIKEDLNKIIAFVDKLNDINTDNVEPLIYMTEGVNVLREDISQDTITHDEALKNSPDPDTDYFKVPKVLSK